MHKKTTFPYICSVVLFALVDADYQFIWIDASEHGSSSDSGIFNISDLATGIESGTLHIPPPSPIIPGENIIILHCIHHVKEVYCLIE